MPVIPRNKRRKPGTAKPIKEQKMQPVGNFTWRSDVRVIIGLIVLCPVCYVIGYQSAVNKAVKTVIHKQEIRYAIKEKHLIDRPNGRDDYLEWMRHRIR